MARLLIIAVAVLSTASAHFAAAADLPTPPHFGKAPVAAPFDWTGFYMGGALGGTWNDTNLTNTISDGAIAWRGRHGCASDRDAITFKMALIAFEAESCF